MAQFDYEDMVQKALRGVVVDILRQVETNGLTGSSHFYVSFQTNRPDVQLSDAQKTKYPDEITIVLENQFWNLRVMAEAFAVTLSFDGVSEELIVPFKAVTRFLDPATRFALKFEPEEVKISPTGDGGGAKTKSKAPTQRSKEGNVVTIDRFRKK